MTSKIGVGIVGLNPGSSWAALAHVPALAALIDQFQIVGVANSTSASGREAAAFYGLPRAFDTPEALVLDPAIDVVVITVRVPHHYRLAKAALDAGKHVYCEWPLANRSDEAQALARLARERGVVAVVGTQAVVAPEIAFLRELIEQRYIGDVLSTTIVGSGTSWGSSVLLANTYLLDPRNGATLLTIPFGHMLSGLQSVLGNLVEVSALLANRRKTSQIRETGDAVALISPDQLAVHGTLHSGAIMAAHYRGGQCGSTNLLWEINGSDGDLRITGASGHLQMVPLSIMGTNHAGGSLEELTPPDPTCGGRYPIGVAGNVARIYALMAHDIRHGTKDAPSFDDAVKLHRTLATIESAAATGTLQTVSQS